MVIGHPGQAQGVQCAKPSRRNQIGRFMQEMAPGARISCSSDLAVSTGLSFLE